MGLEQSELRGEGSGGKECSRSCRALRVHSRTWAFTPRETGALEGSD